MNKNANMKLLLEKAGLAADEIKVFGDSCRIIITCRGRDTAEKWAALLAGFATFEKLVETIAYDKKPKPNRRLLTSVHKVFFVSATVDP